MPRGTACLICVVDLMARPDLVVSRIACLARAVSEEFCPAGTTCVGSALHRGYSLQFGACNAQKVLLMENSINII